MKRAAPENRPNPARARVQPTPEHAALVLRDAAALMAPIALWLLRQGVSYPAFAELLKPVFVAAARGELERAATQPTQSSLSLLSGVHRKDVRELGGTAAAPAAPPRPPLSSQVVTRWLTDRRYRTKDGKPRALPRTGAGRSFESLCRELSNDVHPRAVLDELLRLGQVRLDGERVVMLGDSFIPSPRLDELTALFSANASDHIAAAVSNLTSDTPRFLEQSVYADGMTPESIDLLHSAAREAWAHAFEALVTRARERVDHDAAGDGDRRMRFGVYFFSEPVPDPAAPPPQPTAPKRQRSKRTPP